jgi:hypothetical protein
MQYEEKEGDPFSVAECLLWTWDVHFATQDVSGTVPVISFQSTELKLLLEQRAWKTGF